MLDRVQGMIEKLKYLNRKILEIDKKQSLLVEKEELLEKCKYYLVHDSERKSIALAGRKRCITSGYSNEGMIRSAFKLIYNKKG